MDVVTIGHTSLDTLTIRGKERVQLGGAAVYSALASSIFSKTGIVSRVGQDFANRHFESLKRWGLDVAGIKKGTGKTTTFSITYNEEGRAAYDSYDLGVGKYIKPGDIPDRYLSAKAVHLAPMAASKQKRFVEFLRDNFYGLISLNTHVGYLPQYKRQLLELASEVDVFVLNDEEAMKLTGTKRIEHAINALKKTKHKLMVVTIGVIGSGVLERGEFNFFPSVYQPEVVDFTGCGDAFGGSFISSYIKTGDPLKSANIANSVASINATAWNFKAIKGLGFRDLQAFQEFVFSRQRKLRKNQRSIEHFF
jgi:2-dehydro-3-deoxygluconokinase/2-dehydro-3-deoxygalactonokinase